MRRRIIIVCCLAIVAITIPVSATLLGVANYLGYPQFFYRNATTTQSYNPTTQQFLVNSNEITASFFPFDVEPVSGSPTMTISIYVDNNGNLTGTPTPTDLVMVGTVTDPNTNVTYSGTLLTAQITAFGHDNGGVVSNFDFLFTPTGGTMISYFSGQVVGAYLVSESSTFSGSFTVPFSGFTKGYVGAAPPPCTGTIGDFVWNDANQNGIQDSGEVGINGVNVSLMNGSTVVQTTTTGVGPANQLGY